MSSSPKPLFDGKLVAKHDRYRCVVCGKEIHRRPKGARIAHAEMHRRKGEAYSVVGYGPHYIDEWYAGAAPSGESRVRR